MTLVSADPNNGCVYACTNENCSVATKTIPHSYYHWECNFCGLMRECYVRENVPDYVNETHSTGCAYSMAVGDVCPTYGKVVTEGCSGGTATCISYAKCAQCKQAYGELSECNYKCSWINDFQHQYTCTVCSSWYYEAYTGSTYDCGTYPVCEICNRTYVTALPEHTVVEIPGKSPTCTEDGYTGSSYCSVCGTTTVEQQIIPMIPHTEVTVPGKAATCTRTGLTDGAACSVCGTTTVEQEIIPAKGHRYRKTVTAPGCWKNGITTYTCRVCGDSYSVEANNANMHWFALWMSNADGTHSAACRLCDYTVKAVCTMYEVTVGDTILTVCPVCGAFGEQAFEAIADAKIEAVTKNALPYLGEPIVRGISAPFDGALYAFTAICEYDGQPLPFEGIVAISVPLDAEIGAFKLVRVDVTPAAEATETTEATERTEVLTEIDHTFEDGVLTFESDVSALYLIVPVI